ncbi:MAG: hypothetical protein M5U01_41045 [Ardenticatenaceae bacterium]|nr:hypothetical protein [Ardenticatenaceae bacterium]
MKGSIREAAGEAFVAAMTARMRTLAEELVEQLRSGVAELGSWKRWR